jgi:acyl-[acyl carrier protein]--UDP-N-acetylglucosamine O-acyltransferase
LNRVGLGRRAIPEASRIALEKAFRKLFRDDGVLSEAIDVVDRELGADRYVAKLVTFLKRAKR